MTIKKFELNDMEVNEMSIKEEYILKRRKKKIRLRQLAEYIGCSQSLISRYETGDCEMDKEKVKKYREFIDSYNG
jgi:transcriptional regulator with XRE-family HTH domain